MRERERKRTPMPCNEDKQTYLMCIACVCAGDSVHCHFPFVCVCVYSLSLCVLGLCLNFFSAFSLCMCLAHNSRIVAASMTTIICRNPKGNSTSRFGFFYSHSTKKHINNATKCLSKVGLLKS